MMGRFADCLADEIAQGPAEAEATGRPAAAADGGTGRIALPPGPAAAAAEAAARGRATTAGAPARSPASPPAADDLASPRRRPTDDVLDLGEVSREAILKRALPVVVAIAAAGALVGVLRWRRR
jgi:hypothetical protein